MFHPLGVLYAMDEAVGNLTSALEANGLMDDTLIIFTSDVSGNGKCLIDQKITIYWIESQ